MTLPKKKVVFGNINTKQRLDSDNIKKDLKRIGNMCQQCAENLEQKIDDISREQINVWIPKINDIHKTEIKDLYEET